MKRILGLFLILFLGSMQLSQANLTNGYVVVTKNGASNPPTTQIGSIYDTGTSSGPGNVGIGTTTALNQRLTVNGNASANSFLVNGTGAGNIFSPNGLQFDPNNSTGINLNPVVTIQTGGNVGIGTSGVPSAPLQVTGNEYLSNINGNELTFNLNGSNFGAFYNNLTDSTVYYGATTGINTKPAGIPILTLATDTGNVGIGTAIPNYLLDVQGTSRVTGLVIPGNSVANNYVWTSTGTNGSGIWAAASGGGSTFSLFVTTINNQGGQQ